MTAKIEYLDRPPNGWPGWRLLDVNRCNSRSWDWAAMMTDVPAAHFEKNRDAKICWIRVPGKHRNEEAASQAFEVLAAAEGVDLDEVERADANAEIAKLAAHVDDAADYLAHCQSKLLSARAKLEAAR